MISHAELHERLHYCPIIGLFWWKPRKGDQHLVRLWNSRYAGKIAGAALGNGYGTIGINDKPYLIHRLAWFYETGEWPTATIDHQNGRKLDNAFENLREATYSENNANRPTKRKGLKGAYRSGGRWKASISIKNTTEVIGYFDTEQEAHEAYVRRAKEVFGEFARAA